MTTGNTDSLTRARADDSSRRRQAVLKALNAARNSGEAITVSGIARAAGVHRTFLYRHADLHATVLAEAAKPLPTPTGHPAVSRESLLADLVNLQARNARMAQTISTLERRLSETLGEDVWRTSGLGAPTDIDTLQRRITELEQINLDLRDELAERQDELDAARDANRELITRLNTR
ncbi:DUF6262 family protein [Nocardia sp. NPDC059246]|uniref:DUF6262 family protein n=1 Tax=unclassified Nocardia TaxID=2637762 RepID=UPI0036C5E408